MHRNLSISKKDTVGELLFCGCSPLRGSGVLFCGGWGTAVGRSPATTETYCCEAPQALSSQCDRFANGIKHDLLTCVGNSGSRIMAVDVLFICEHPPGYPYCIQRTKQRSFGMFVSKRHSVRRSPPSSCVFHYKGE